MISPSHVDAHGRAPTVEEVLNHLADKMAWPDGAGQPRSLAT